MPIPIKILQSNGALIPAPFEVESLSMLALNEPEGVYTVARTYNRMKSVLLDAHLERLEESARLEHIPVVFHKEQLRAGLAKLIEDGGFPESRFRITIPRVTPDQAWMAVEPLEPVPTELKRGGVKVSTCEIIRPNPKAKSNVWASLRHEAIQCFSEHTYEGIILNDQGYLLEGFSSNIYTIHENVLKTANEGILHGIARQILLKIAADILSIRLEPTHKDQLAEISEAFLTSSSRGIIPIVQIDDLEVGNGEPGPNTRKLSEAYDRWVEQHLEPIA